MALRKTPEADLKQKYPLYIQIGAVVALLLLLAFVNAPVDTGEPVEVIEANQEIIEIEDIEQTQQIQPPPPPPAPPPPQEVPDDAVIEDEIIEDMEMDLDEFVPPPAAAPTPPAPPPPPPSNEPAPPPPEPEPQEPEIFDVVEQEPELIGGIEGLQGRVEYPEMARRAGVEGTVYIQFVVDEQGRVSQAVCARSPNEMLCDASIEAVQQSQFRPGMQRGRPVKVRFTVPVRFKLN